jgi:hypothetical protein
MHWVRAVLSSLTGVCVFAGVVLAQSVICQKCGYENPMSNTSCFHCGTAFADVQQAPLPERKAAAAKHTFTAAGKLEFLGPDAVESELAMGVDSAGKGDLNTAYLFIRNAAALETLTRPDAGSERSLRINDLLKRSAEKRGTAYKACRECDGSGKASMEVRSTTGEVTHRTVGNRPCPACQGSGKVAFSGSVDERVFAMGQAKTRYDGLQRARKFAMAGGAWIPGDLEGKLTTRQMAALKRVTAAPCRNCSGLGRVQCSRCVGKGAIACTNRQCQKGKVTVTQTSSLSNSKTQRQVPCPVCKGKPEVACSMCEGRGSLVCDRCSGTGQRAACERCAGQGITECRYCRGVGGQAGKPCPHCRSEGVIECASCNGDGHK